jgi:hypothetical protein
MPRQISDMMASSRQASPPRLVADKRLPASLWGADHVVLLTALVGPVDRHPSRYGDLRASRSPPRGDGRTGTGGPDRHPKASRNRPQLPPRRSCCQGLHRVQSCTMDDRLLAARCRLRHRTSPCRTVGLRAKCLVLQPRATRGELQNRATFSSEARWFSRCGDHTVTQG